MAKSKRTVAELVETLKVNPGALTPAELRFVRAEVKRMQGGGGARRADASTLAGGREDYEKIKSEAAARRRSASRAGRDIGELPAVADAGRKAAALASLRVFCETYFRRRFRLAWSQTHLAVLEAVQRTIEHGGRHVKAVERGFGKTSILEVATLYGTFKGLHAFVQLIGSSKGHALEMLDSIRGELEENELLAADFPEVCFPIQALEGIANRAAGQLYKGKRTKIGITKEELTLPTIEGSPASGAIIRVTGITGRIRGRKKRLVRPSLVLLDDPQTDASAQSVSQTVKREEIITGAVVGLAGPDREISVLMAGTVIEVGDLMDRFLDPGRHRDWTKQRFAMLKSFPANMALWEQYWSIRVDELRNGGDGRQATEFYRDRRALMDAGGEASWAERFRPGEISAVQHAMNLFYADRRAFAREYQNQPEKAAQGEEQLVAAEIIVRVNGIERGVAPLKAVRLTAGVDVQAKLLYWMVVAWKQDFTGCVVDYGTEPEQGRMWFHSNEVQRTLLSEAPGGQLEAAIRAGLDRLWARVLGREWPWEGGPKLRIEKALCDANWSQSTDVVYDWCRQAQVATVAMPSHGRYVGAKSKPWSAYQNKAGERLGWHWLVPAAAGRAIRHVSVDTNWFKTIAGGRLKTPMGGRGALTLFGQQPKVHGLLGEHLAAEFFVDVEAQGKRVREWQLRPEAQGENHWLDCLVLATCAASMQGCVLAGVGDGKRSGRRQVSFAEEQRKAWEEAA